MTTTLHHHGKGREMSEMQEDIRKAAREIASARYVGSQWKHMKGYFADGLYDNDEVVIEAAKAILAERERCAGKADEQARDWRNGVKKATSMDAHHYANGRTDSAVVIAKAIRGES